MNILCLFGLHKKYLMPWVIERKRSRPGPEYCCKRCGKLWYSHVMYISSPERPLFSSPRVYEFQPPPKGYASWEEFHTRRRQAIDEMVERVRNGRSGKEQ